MNIESIREYCLALPCASEDSAFGVEYVLFRVCGKIFACVGLERNDYFVVKCDPDYAIELRDIHPEIEPAWHWNKRYWNQISLTGSLTDGLIQSLIRHSYAEVVKKLPKRVKTDHPAIVGIH